MQQHTRAEVSDLTYANLPDNATGAINPAKLREVLLALIASYLNLLDDGNPGPGPGGGPPPAQATFGNLGGNASDNTSLVSYVASLGHTLTEFAAPLVTSAGRWYLTPTGIWEARSSFNASAPPAANAYWRLVAGFGDALQATVAGRALLAAPTAVAQRQLLDIFSTTAGQYGAGQPAFTNAYRADGALIYLLQQAAYLRTQLAALTTPVPGGPVITGFLPTKAPVGASVTLTGTGFAKASAVFFNGTPASFQVVNPTTLIATVPAGATTGPITVVAGGVTNTSAARFTVSAGATLIGPADNTTPSLRKSVEYRTKAERTAARPGDTSSSTMEELDPLSMCLGTEIYVSNDPSGQHEYQVAYNLNGALLVWVDGDFAQSVRGKIQAAIVPKVGGGSSAGAPGFSLALLPSGDYQPSPELLAYLDAGGQLYWMSPSAAGQRTTILAKSYGVAPGNPAGTNAAGVNQMRTAILALNP